MRSPSSGSGRSLLLTLMIWIAPALLALLVGTALVTGSTATTLADSAYDRSIAGALKAIDLNISTESGGLGVELPYPLFEAFEATASGSVYFRVTTSDGLVDIGDSFLPNPQAFTGDGFRFYNETFMDARVRMGVLRRTLEKPLYGAVSPQTIIVQVAESMQSRDAFRFEIIKSTAVLNLLCVIAVVGLLIAGVARALAPLSTLRTSFEQRDPNDLSAVDDTSLPREISPLVDTFNRLLSRHAAQAEAQRHLLDDASHQLKTPIAVLRTQVDYALYSRGEDERRSVLEAMRTVIERAARTTAHFLTMARARALLHEIDPAMRAPVDIKALLIELARMRLPDARRRRVDVNLDLPDANIHANGSETLIFEAVSNLLDNAIRHSPQGAGVTLCVVIVGGTVEICLADEGPGMKTEDIDQVGRRHIDLGQSRTGTGLGLAVVVAIAQAHAGSLRLANRPEGGLAATLTLMRHLAAQTKVD